MFYDLPFDDELVAMMVIHMDDIQVSTSQNVAEIGLGAPHDSLPTKGLDKLLWYMGSEYRRDSEQSIVKIPD